MLIIAQPKSASTSLIYTLAKMTGLKCDPTYLDSKRKFKKNNECLEMQKYHKTIFKIPNKLLLKWVTEKKCIYKVNIVPTNYHLRLLEKLKPNRIIILLRSPEDSLESYKRGIEKNKNYDQLLNDLRFFHDRYIWWKSLQSNFKIIDYNDLILNYKNSIKSILNWFNLKHRKIIPLMKCKYTGIGEKRIKNDMDR